MRVAPLLSAPLLGTGLLLFSPAIAAFQPCPVLGSVFPAPTSLSSSPVMKAAFQNLTDLLDTLVFTDNNTKHGPVAANETTFSIAIFSTDGKAPASSLYQYHHTASALANATLGVQNVDENSIYRIGSITKLLAVYTFLLEVGDGYWNEPVTKYVPELIAAGTAARKDPITHVEWQHVTLGELASQMAGVGRDDLLGNLEDLGADLTGAGFPPSSSTPPCSRTKQCSRKEFLDHFSQHYPVFMPGTTPIYSNAGFGILAYALESIANKNFKTMLDERVLKPLNMTHSSLFTPSDWKSGVIVPTHNISSWTTSIGPEAAGGNAFSSLADLTKLGSSILSSSLLSPYVTRRWLKPVTHTSSAKLSVGHPWEIFRAPSTTSRQIIDLYTKAGNLDNYGALIVLAPDYQVGFTILGAGEASVDPHVYADVITDILYPALDEAARIQAQRLFAGSYRSQDPGLNSSIVISGDDGLPGMRIDSIISNGTDFISVISLLIYGVYSPAYTALTSFRLYPTNIRSSSLSGSRIAFRAIYEYTDSLIDNGVFSNNCETWFNLDSILYAGKAWDEFVFNLDADGSALSIELPILGATLERVN